MIRKFALLLFVGVLLAGCTDINYDGETRLVLEGRLVNEQGEPLPNRYVDIAVYATANYGSHSSDIISSGTSDLNGNFQFIVPAPKGVNNHMSIRINPGNNSYQYKEFALIQLKDFEDYRFDVHDVTMYARESIVWLVVTLQQSNVAHILTHLDIEGNRADETVFINPLVLDYQPYDNYFSVVRNQTVVLHYTILDQSDPNNPMSTDYELPINIGNEPQVNYLLNY